MTLSYELSGFSKRAPSVDRLAAGPCSLAYDNGDPCDRDSIGNNAPFDICGPHALALFRYMNTLVAEAQFVDIPTQINMTQFVRGAEIEKFGTLPDSMNGWPAVVYYIAAGEHIKIGTSRRLRSRLRDYPPCTRLLALEPGGPEVERERHERFAEFRVTREWFEPAADLVEHIRDVADRGLPPGPLITAADLPVRKEVP